MAAAAAASQDQAQEARRDLSVSGGGDCYDDNDGEQLMELNSSATQHMLKARKPYTITKQREKWTDEEHQKFLEALKLYGRGWRKIQEHIGTKTAVQIRSHAQKFFSKVVRETTGGSEASIKPTEIPPPRPKRKPLHPYPRKCVDVLNTSSNQFERSQSPNLLGMETENHSPTSVLSVVASEPLESPVSETKIGCSSLTSCTSDVQSFSLLHIEKESVPVGSEENAPSSPIGSSSRPLTEKLPTPPMDDSKIAASAEETRAVLAPSKSFKLFGKTVLVTDPEKTYFCSAEKSTDVLLSLGLASHDRTEVKRENTSFSEANFSLHPWGLSPGPEVNMKLKEAVDERSCTGSDAGSTSEVPTRERSSDVVESQRQLPNLRSNSNRGFMPYKRCLAERDMKSSLVASEERDQQRARVCS